MTLTNPLLSGSTAKPAPAAHPIHELLTARWSPRAFADVALTPAEIATLFEAARWTASTANEQPWAFVYAQRADTENFARILDTLAPGNQVWAKNAAVLMITVMRINRPGKDVPAAAAQYDLGQSVAMLSVQATAMGIGVHQMGGFDAAKAQDVLGVPASHRCVTAIALGRPAPADTLPADLAERERAARVRHPQDAFVFNGTWTGGAA